MQLPQLDAQNAADIASLLKWILGGIVGGAAGMGGALLALAFKLGGWTRSNEQLIMRVEKMEPEMKLVPVLTNEVRTMTKLLEHQHIVNERIGEKLEKHDEKLHRLFAIVRAPSSPEFEVSVGEE